MATGTGARLTPKVRRLLRDHGLQARSVAGTGTGARVTPHDVLRAAGVPRRPSHGGVLASPLARRLLREAGLDLAAAARANDGQPITAAHTTRLTRDLAGHPAGSPQGGPADAAPPRTTTSEIDVDVARLLAGLAAANQDFHTRHGFVLSTEVALATAAAAVLTRGPALAVAAALRSPEDGRGRPGVGVGFPRPDAAVDTIAVVADVQYLTVAGLARRARAAVTGTAAGPTTTTGPPALVVATEATAPADLARLAAIGLLTLGTTTHRRVDGVDRLGHQVTTTRPHARVRLHHDERTSPTAAAAFLDRLAAAVSSWGLPFGA